MADPFQDVDAAGPDFIKMFADTMDVRQSDPAMERIVRNYLSKLDVSADSHVIEVGAGAGAVSRRIADQLAPATVTGFEPSTAFVKEARTRAEGRENLRFVAANGAELPVENDTVDVVIMHTVLTHVTEPLTLLTEAHRVLKPGGTLVVCDADFSKATFSSFVNDPLDACARSFVSDFVTDPFIVGKLRSLLAEAGFDTQDFGIESRVVTGAEQMRPWVEVTTAGMVERGEIGAALAEAMIAEHDRRAEAGTLYGYQAFGTAIARKP